MLEHIKALNENTRALVAHTKALNIEQKGIDTEHNSVSACKFCGITFKTLKSYVANGMISPLIRKGGKREWYKESDLVALCDAQKLYSGEYGQMRENPASMYFVQ